MSDKTENKAKEKPGFSISMELLEDYTFKIDFDEFGYIITDEPAPLGSGEGPNPSRLVASAAANCLSASLIFALSKKKQKVGKLHAKANGSLHRVDGFWRIEHIDVTITLDTGEIAQDILEDVMNVFEDYCVVTQSIRQGIPVSLAVEDMSGKKLK